MIRVSVDFNNIEQSGLLTASLRKTGELKVGQSVIAVDPGEDEEFRATVVEVNPLTRTVTFSVDWEPVALSVRPRIQLARSPSSMFDVSFGTQTSGDSAIVRLSPKRIASSALA